MAAIPATFMTVVVTSYILIAPEGFKMSESIGNPVGLVVAAISAIAFYVKFNPIYKKAVENK